MDLTSILPARSVEDLLAGRIVVTLGAAHGGQPIDLPVLPIKANRAWRERFGDQLDSVFTALDAVEDPAGFVAFIGSQTDLLWELLAAYDQSGALPEWSWVDEHATEPELIRALLEVVVAAFPLAATVLSLGLAGTAPPKQTPAPPAPAPTSSAPTSTAGRRARSKS